MAGVELPAEGLVPEELVRAGEALEVGGGVGVVGALVGVTEPRLGAVGLLDLLDAQRRAFLAGREAEYLVVIYIVTDLPRRRHVETIVVPARSTGGVPSRAR